VRFHYYWPNSVWGAVCLAIFREGYVSSACDVLRDGESVKSMC
jgi:hypothetical protein